MNATRPYPDIQALDDALAAAEDDARALAAGLSEELGSWRPSASAWSIAECFDHLAVANTVYLQAMEPPAAQAKANGQARRRPAVPGIVGGWFVRMLEPPVKPRFRIKAPTKIEPRRNPALQDAVSAFLASQSGARNFLRTYADVDLTGVRFPNPFVGGVRFSLATGLHVIAAHDRRHLWQAWQVRRALQPAGGARR